MNKFRVGDEIKFDRYTDNNIYKILKMKDGWIHSLQIVSGNTQLIGRIYEGEWDEEGKKLIKRKTYKSHYPEWW